MKWAIVRGFGKVKYFNISYVVLLIVPILVELHAKATSGSTFFKNLVAFPPALRRKSVLRNRYRHLPILMP